LRWNDRANICGLLKLSIVIIRYTIWAYIYVFIYVNEIEGMGYLGARTSLGVGAGRTWWSVVENQNSQHFTLSLSPASLSLSSMSAAPFSRLQLAAALIGVSYALYPILYLKLPKNMIMIPQIPVLLTVRHTTAPFLHLFGE
jgi:hypothetical protein